MTKVCVATMCLLFYFTVCAAKEELPLPVAVFSFSDTSCDAWTKSATNKTVRAQYSSWFRGFVSGYNKGEPENQVQLERMPEGENLFLFVDKYCQDNPENPFVSAAFKLVDELRERPVAVQ
jgi:hypothetical protein